ncbi:uncharacterized protein F4812DRAFT_444001 [Daldinia caldariorum]|uniref:uncharacterized protein n=1 Tax=Daldinia caldariorum TaxID=326644 RepID=UPI002008B6E5|nr:uncharacterized protein F4812DRAFT_444001 [Daldinia caldariorum]KAI1464262.1 hypothetical protein F4812DRAFT_444001 [Daldinia caldariorum]
MAGCHLETSLDTFSPTFRNNSNGITPYYTMARPPRSDVDDGESQRSSHNRRGGVHIDTTSFPFTYSQSSKSETYSPDGPSYYLHPCANHSNDTNDQHEKSNADQPITRVKSLSRPGAKALRRNRPVTPAPAAPNAGTSTNVNAELKVSLAARQLAFQINESKKFWVTFQDEFEAEVNAVKYYVSDDVLQRIWQKRIEHNSKYKSDEDQDDEQFKIQKMKLEACLDQVKEAAKAYMQSHPLSNPSDHDPRQIALEKVQVAGDRVLLLAEKSTLSNVACADLVTQASDLEKLVDSQSPDAKILHRFDKRETRRNLSGGEDMDPVATEPAFEEQDSPGQDAAHIKDKDDES